MGDCGVWVRWLVAVRGLRGWHHLDSAFRRSDVIKKSAEIDIIFTIVREEKHLVDAYSAAAPNA